MGVGEGVVWRGGGHAWMDYIGCFRYTTGGYCKNEIGVEEFSEGGALLHVFCDYK